MSPDERKELWEELSLVEDWLSGGARRERELPDFEAAARSAAQAAEAAATAATAGAAPSRAAFGPGAGGQGAAGPGQARQGRRPAEPGDSLEAVAREVAACEACRLAAGRSRPVPGEGAERPLVLVVGEGPGAEEDRSGRPFVGPAGQLLDRMLASIGLSRETNCHIANVVKCRPPNNRDPAPDETAACIGYLRRQAALLEPRIVLCVGRVAAQALLGTGEGIGRLRGRFLEWEGIPLLATYHPSALLRDESLKRPAWEDLKALKAFLDAEPAAGGAAESGARAGGASAPAGGRG